MSAIARRGRCELEGEGLAFPAGVDAARAGGLRSGAGVVLGGRCGMEGAQALRLALAAAVGNPLPEEGVNGDRSGGIEGAGGAALALPVITEVIAS